MNIEQLMNDEAFTAQLENAKDLAEVAALLQAQGIEVTEAQLKAALAAGDSELDETALEAAAGGLLPVRFGRIVREIVKILPVSPPITIQPIPAPQPIRYKK